MTAKVNRGIASLVGQGDVDHSAHSACVGKIVVRAQRTKPERYDEWKARARSSCSNMAPVWCLTHQHQALLI